MRERIAAAVEHEEVPYRRSYRTILDVGAGRGQFALVAARRFPDAAILCFEPLPEARAALGRALSDHPAVTVLERAVTDFNGETEFVVSHADDSSSLLPMTEHQTTRFPGTEEAHRITVATATLDALVSPNALSTPVLLKLDVQGAELLALRGASELLAHVETVLVECSFVELYHGQSLAAEVITLLTSCGFKLEAVCAPQLDEQRRVVQADLLFER